MSRSQPATLAEESPALDSFHLGRVASLLVGVVEPVPPRSHEWQPAYPRRMLGRMLVLLALAIVPYLIVGSDQSKEDANPAATAQTNQHSSIGLSSASGFRDWIPTPSTLHWIGPNSSPALRLLGRFENRLGGSPLSHRLFGLSLHLINVLLLWFLLRRLRVPVGWMVAAIFAVHPGGVAAVARIDQHGRLWGVLFFLMATVSLLSTLGISAVEQKKQPSSKTDADHDVPLDAVWEDEFKTTSSRFREWLGIATVYGIALASAWLGSLCQPTAAMAIAPIVLLLVIWLRKMDRKNAFRVLSLLSPFLLLGGLVLIAGIVSSDGPPAGSVLYGIHFLTAPLRQLWEAGWAVRWALMPYPPAGAGQISAQLLAQHSTGAGGSFAVQTAVIYLLGIAAALLLLVLFILKALSTAVRFSGSASIAICIALACTLLLLPTLFAPVLKTDQDPSWLLGDGETYLVAIPLLLLAALAIMQGVDGLEMLLHAPIHRIVAQVSTITVMLAALILLAASRVDYTANPQHLLESAVAADPSSQGARAQLAQYFLTHQDIPSALTVLGGMSMNQCTSAAAAVCEGDISRATGRTGAALIWYQRAQALAETNHDISDPELFGKIAETDSELGRPGDSRATFERGVRLFPRSAELHNDYGTWLTLRHELDAAVSQLRQAVDADPDNVPAHINLANTLILQQKYAEAADQLRIAILLDPNNPVAFHNAGAILASMKDYEDACRMLIVAVALDPKSAETHNDYAVALADAGRYKHAIFEFERAIALRPNYPDAEKNLEISRARAEQAATTRGGSGDRW